MSPVITFSGKSDSSTMKSGLNLAEKNAFSSDLEDQVERMIARMKRNDQIDFTEDWKVCAEKLLISAANSTWQLFFF